MLGTPEAPGIFPRAITDLFAPSYSQMVKEIKCSILELYQVRNCLDEAGICYVDGSASVYSARRVQDTLKDMLVDNPTKDLQVRMEPNGNVVIPEAHVQTVLTEAEMHQLTRKALDRRKVAQTNMNASSSRSHLFIVLTVLTESSTGVTTRGKLTLVDLAGSERVARSGALENEQLLREASSINKSLSALGDVVSALTSSAKFVPYRNHKLTQLLSDSLGGSAKTLMIVNLSPLAEDTQETRSSLDYAIRVKQVLHACPPGCSIEEPAVTSWCAACSVCVSPTGNE
eukprot:scaffold1637_cov410-Prasinococcus_capsulatus_cf.AAC.11